VEEALKLFEEKLREEPLEPIRYYAVIEKLENIILKKYLEDHKYSIARASEFLGVNRSTLSMRMMKLGLENIAFTKRKGISNEESSKESSSS
jgi:DNA-binding NtrC family response regulator